MLSDRDVLQLDQATSYFVPFSLLVDQSRCEVAAVVAFVEIVDVVEVRLSLVEVWVFESEGGTWIYCGP